MGSNDQDQICRDAMAHQLQANRFELKYLIEESRARAIRDFVRGYLEPDEHVRDSRTCAYSIYSLYLDTPTLLLYSHSVRGLKNRFKLRIRFYDDVPEHPAFLEIKRRLTDVICKERAAICRAGVQRLLNGRWPAFSDLIQSNGNRNAEGALERFGNLVDELGAQPATYVCYEREAYVSPDSDQLRVTFDRQIRGETFDARIGLAPPKIAVPAKIRGVVFELKFMDRFPQWMRELAWSFDLQRRSLAKYVHCVDALDIRPGRWLGSAPRLGTARPDCRSGHGHEGPARPATGSHRDRDGLREVWASKPMPLSLPKELRR
jgi:hypothetical protein